MRYPLIAAGGLALLATAFFAPQAPAQDGRDAPRDRRCVGLQEIDKTTVVDESTVLFYLKNRTIYENRLARTCPGLANRGTTLMYRVVLDQLCDGDTINVLDNHGFGYIQTAACGLGVFAPIEPDAAEALLAKSKAR